MLHVRKYMSVCMSMYACMCLRISMYVIIRVCACMYVCLHAYINVCYRYLIDGSNKGSMYFTFAMRAEANEVMSIRWQFNSDLV